jgi:hypothetical protein
MGAGSARAGLGLSGVNPVIPGSDPTKTNVVAMRYEGSTKDWELDANNNFAAVTPNEQGVVLSMSINQGDIKSSPTTGNTIGQIEYLGATNLGQDVTNRVMTSNPIARLVAAGSVSIDKIDYKIVNKNKLAVVVYFRDLDVDPNRVNPVTWST